MNKILFLIQLPPPIHGASVVNKTIMDSQAINTFFETRYVNISPAAEIADLGKVSFKKILATLQIYLLALKTYLIFKPELVYLTLSPHGAAFYKDGLLAVMLKMFGAKMVFHMHGKGINTEALKSRFKKTVYRLVFEGVDIIHLSESLFHDVENVRDHTRTLVAIPNGVPAPPQLNIEKSDGIITFIYLSNLVRTKGADILVKAASLLPPDLQNKLQVKIVGKSGDQTYTSEIEKLLTHNPHKNIELLGPKFGEEKYRELLSSHVFVLPTKFKNECFPLSILEAMSCGLAVISTREGAIPNIVENGITGEVLDECTPEALATAMTNYIESPNYLASCATASREKYHSHYNAAAFEQKLITTLRAFISQ
ncbi:MAG: glycosyltransferase family 4 protein [Candidimonas sp.]|nr:glycosyltransferase family 4 protein [Candidimonas sp.]